MASSSIVVKVSVVDRASMPIQMCWWRLLWFAVEQNVSGTPGVAQRRLDEARRCGACMDHLPEQLI